MLVSRGVFKQLSLEWSQYCVVTPVGWCRYQLSVAWRDTRCPRPRRARVPRRKRLYSNPGIRTVVFPMCPSGLGIGRPFAGPVERLRIDCGSVVSPRPTNRNSSSKGILPWSGRCGTHLSPNAQVAKLQSASACDVLWQSRVRRSSRLRDAISTQNG